MDWMLCEDAKTWDEEQIQHRLDWYKKQGDQWFAELVKASNELAWAKSRVEVAEHQVDIHARSIKELTEYANQFGKLLV